MKKMLLIGLLSLGIAAAQGTPQNYENLGGETWQSYNLKGKVKEFTECLAETSICSTVRFNQYGVALESLRNRKLVSGDQNKVVFEYDFSTLEPINQKNKVIEVYQNNVLIERTLYTDDKIRERVILEYKSNRRSKITHYDSIGLSNPKETVEYVYKDNHLISVTSVIHHRNMISISEYDKNENIIKLTKKMDGEEEIEDFNYTLDRFGNWTRKEGQMDIFTRKYTYY